MKKTTYAIIIMIALMFMAMTCSLIYAAYVAEPRRHYITPDGIEVVEALEPCDSLECQ